MRVLGNSTKEDGSGLNGHDRLMYGENTATRSYEDVIHWITAYTELLAFKDRLLIDMERGIELLSKPAELEIRELDVTLIVKQRERYNRRLDYWRGRQTEMRRTPEKLA
jgi:hypothetical protein